MSPRRASSYPLRSGRSRKKWNSPRAMLVRFSSVGSHTSVRLSQRFPIGLMENGRGRGLGRLSALPLFFSLHFSWMLRRPIRHVEIWPGGPRRGIQRIGAGPLLTTFQSRFRTREPVREKAAVVLDSRYCLCRRCAVSTASRILRLGLPNDAGDVPAHLARRYRRPYEVPDWVGFLFRPHCVIGGTVAPSMPFEGANAWINEIHCDN